MPKKADPLDAPLTKLRQLARTLPGAEEYVMVHHPAFRVGKKPFAIIGMDHAPTLSINLGHEAQASLLGDARFSRTHYIGQHGWVTVDYHALTSGEVASLVEGSWQRIAGKKHLAAHATGPSPPSGAAPRRPQNKPSAAGTPRAPGTSTSKKKRPAGAPRSPRATTSKKASAASAPRDPAATTSKKTSAASAPRDQAATTSKKTSAASARKR